MTDQTTSTVDTTTNEPWFDVNRLAPADLRAEATALAAEIDAFAEQAYELADRARACHKRCDEVRAAARDDLECLRIASGLNKNEFVHAEDGVAELVGALTGADRVWELLASISDALHPDTVFEVFKETPDLPTIQHVVDSLAGKGEG